MRDSFCSLFSSSQHTCLSHRDDQFPASVIRETQFESVQLQPEEIPAPLPQETSEPESLAEPSDSQTILAPDQPGNIQRGAGQQLGGTSDPNDTVLDPNQVGNLMTRLDALEMEARSCQLCDSVVSFNSIAESTARIPSHERILETCSTVLVSEELVFRQLEKLLKQMHSVLKWILVNQVSQVSLMSGVSSQSFRI